MSTNYTNSINDNFRSAKSEIETIKSTYTPLQTTQALNNAIQSISNSSGGGGGIPPSICKNMTIKRSGTSVYLKWQDPEDTVIDKQYLSSWAGTKIVKKQGSFPENESDGTVVVDNTVKNQYFNSAYTDTIEQGEEWYYTAFPYSKNGVYCYNNKNKFYDAIIYEFCINPNDSNPATRVSYPSGCTNENYARAYMDYSNGVFNYGDWENAFFMPRPVMLKSDGTVDYEIYKPDFRYKADGSTASDYNNQNYDGNLMIGFPQVWFKFEMSGTLQHIYVANMQVDEDYHCYTHINKNGVLLDEIYVMAYQPANISNKLRSLSGKSMLVSATGTTEITYAQNNGACWNLMDFGIYNMIANLLFLMAKTTDTQTAYGYGRGANSSQNLTTGECDTNGMFYGTQASGKLKVFGIENYWGNTWKRINGCVYNTTNGMKYKLCDYTTDGSSVVGYNTDGSGYLTHQTFSGTSGGYISQTLLTSKGIFPTVASGSSSTYLPDGLWWANNGFAIVGGDGYSSGGKTLLCGAYCLALDNAVSDSYATRGGSLSCKPL